VDDLWKLGKAVGRGGPWLLAAVKPGEPSDPYLMTGYDRKTIRLAHDASEPVTFTRKVAHGNPPGALGTASATSWRAALPIAPPAPIAISTPARKPAVDRPPAGET
jgi:hypothetical protein